MIPLSKEHLVYMNIGERFWGATLDDMTEEQHSAMNTFVNRLPDYIAHGLGIFLWGDNSRGKSYIAAALCKRVWGQYRVTSYCITASELKDCWIQDRPAHPGSTETVLQRVMSARFLVIDDIGKEHRAASGFAENRFGHLLRQRSKLKLVTSLTLNFTPKEFAEVYGKSTAELVQESMIPVRLIGENMRHLIAEELGGVQ